MDTLLGAFMDSFVGPVFGLVFSALATIAGVYAIRFLRKLEQKTGIDLNWTQECMIKDLAEGAVYYVEQEAAKRLKIGDTPLASDEKRKMGFEALKARALEAGISAGYDKVNRELESALGRIKASVENNLGSPRIPSERLE